MQAKGREAIKKIDCQSGNDQYTFNYKTIEREAVALKKGEKTVAAIGAGPVGLSAALPLGNQGIPCKYPDHVPSTNPHSRAFNALAEKYGFAQQAYLAGAGKEPVCQNNERLSLYGDTSSGGGLVRPLRVSNRTTTNKP